MKPLGTITATIASSIAGSAFAEPMFYGGISLSKINGEVQECTSCNFRDVNRSSPSVLIGARYGDEFFIGVEAEAGKSSGNDFFGSNENHLTRYKRIGLHFGKDFDAFRLLGYLNHVRGSGFNDLNAVTSGSGHGFGIGIERDISEKVILRFDILRDEIDNPAAGYNYSWKSTTARVGALFRF